MGVNGAYGPPTNQIGVNNSNLSNLTLSLGFLTPDEIVGVQSYALPRININSRAYLTFQHQTFQQIQPIDTDIPAGKQTLDLPPIGYRVLVKFIDSARQQLDDEFLPYGQRIYDLPNRPISGIRFDIYQSGQVSDAPPIGKISYELPIVRKIERFRYANNNGQQLRDEFLPVGYQHNIPFFLPIKRAQQPIRLADLYSIILNGTMTAQLLQVIVDIFDANTIQTNAMLATLLTASITTNSHESVENGTMVAELLSLSIEAY